MKSLALLAALVCFSAADFALAGSATWGAMPATNDYNTASNWNPATVPNAPTDIATFATSAVTQLSISSDVTVDSMIFGPGADSFSLSATSTQLIFSGDGVTNESGQTQFFTLNGTPQSPFLIEFENLSNAGEAANYVLSGGGNIYFTGKATAGSATFVAESDYDKQPGSYRVYIEFNGGPSVKAGNATFNLLHHSVVAFDGGTAENATFNVAGGILAFDFHGDAGDSIIDCSEGGSVTFYLNSISGGAFHATAHGATGRKGSPGLITMGSDHAAAGTFVVEGGIGQQSRGGTMVLNDSGTLSDGNATVTGGKSGGLGGTLSFAGRSDGGTARISLSGNAMLDLSRHDRGDAINVGSIEGKGTVILGAIPVYLGNNNLSTAFSGVIQDGDSRPGIGPLLKVGSGTLILSGASTYVAGTTVSAGALSVTNLSGSATGTGPVTVSGGTLGGSGIIGGAVTVGPAVLWPSVALSDPATLTVQGSLTLGSGSTYTCRLNSKKMQSDSVTANGVTIASDAQFDFMSVATKQLPPGMTFVVLNNTSATPISGTFANLADGATINAGQNNLKASYEGGDGNDLTLTVE